MTTRLGESVTVSEENRQLTRTEADPFYKIYDQWSHVSRKDHSEDLSAKLNYGFQGGFQNEASRETMSSVILTPNKEVSLEASAEKNVLRISDKTSKLSKNKWLPLRTAVHIVVLVLAASLLCPPSVQAQPTTSNSNGGVTSQSSLGSNLLNSASLKQNHSFQSLQESVFKWKSKMFVELANQVQGTISNISHNLNYVESWATDRQDEFDQAVDATMLAFKRTFPEGYDNLTNLVIQSLEEETRNSFKLLANSLNRNVTLARLKSRFYPQNEAVREVARAGLQLRRERNTLNTQIDSKRQEEVFNSTWENYLDMVRQQFNRESESNNLRNEIDFYYQTTLNSNGVDAANFNKTDITGQPSEWLRKSFEDYASFLRLKLQEAVKVDPKSVFQESASKETPFTPSFSPEEYFKLSTFFDFDFRNTVLFVTAESVLASIDQHLLRQLAISSILNQSRLAPHITQIEELRKFQVNVRLLKRIFAEMLLLRSEGGNSTFELPLDLFSNLTEYLYSEHYKNISKHTYFKQAKMFETLQNQSRPLKELLLEAIRNIVEEYNQQDLAELLANATNNATETIRQSFETVGITVNLTGFALNSTNYTATLKRSENLTLNESRLQEKFDLLPLFVNKEALLSKILFEETPGSISFATVALPVLKLRKEYSDEKLLQPFDGKLCISLRNASSQLKQYLTKDVNATALIDYVVNLVRGLLFTSNGTIQGRVGDGASLLSSEIKRFNSELSRVSLRLSGEFEGRLHEVCLMLLWKQNEEDIWSTREQFLIDLQNEEKSQRAFFREIIEGNNNQQDIRNAHQLVDAYGNFMRKWIIQAKSEKLAQAGLDFTTKYSRDNVEELIVAQQLSTENVQAAYDSLTRPTSYLRRYYNRLIESYLKDLDDHFTREMLANLRELLEGAGQTLALLNRDDAQEWRQALFIGTPNENLKKLFSERFSAVESEQLTNLTGVVQPANIAFLNSTLLDDFQFYDLAAFVKAVHQKINNTLLPRLTYELIQDEFDGDYEMERFKRIVRKTLCQQDCLNCEDFCIERAFVPQVSSDYTSEEAIKPVVRTIPPDYDPFSEMWFNDQKLDWQMLCSKGSSQYEWNFKDSKFQTARQQELFKKQWGLSRGKLCELHTTIERIKQKAGSPEELQQALGEASKLAETQFVFAIDGSGSMMGERWEQLLSSLNVILRDLTFYFDSRVSIVQFSQYARTEFFDEDPASIRTSKIQQMQQGTEFNRAFHESSKLMRPYVGKSNLFFIFISDGQASHPESGIARMLELRRQTIRNGYRFEYASLLIGHQQSEGMTLINKSMKGTNDLANDSSQVTDIFKKTLRAKE